MSPRRFVQWDWTSVSVKVLQNLTGQPARQRTLPMLNPYFYYYPQFLLPELLTTSLIVNIFFLKKKYAYCVSIFQYFHQLGPLGRVGLVVAMSVRPFIHSSVFNFFVTSHWPSDHIISSRPLPGATKTSLLCRLQAQTLPNEAPPIG